MSRRKLFASCGLQSFSGALCIRRRASPFNSLVSVQRRFFPAQPAQERALQQDEAAIQRQLRQFSNYQISQLTLSQFTEFGLLREENAINAVKFLRNELPVRLAHMIREIDSLPHELLETAAAKRVRSWYVSSFLDLLGFPSTFELESMKDKAERDRSKRDFDKLIEEIKVRHNPTVTTMAQAVMELKDHAKASIMDESVQFFLDRFFMSRIGLRMLLSQYLTLFAEGSQAEPQNGLIGVIDPRCQVAEVAKDAIANASFLCEQYYCCAPEVRVIDTGEPGWHFQYVPAHLHHILFELLKNSMRATIESHGIDSDEFPPIKIIIVKGEEDVTIKVSDEGGGILRREIPLVFCYHYTTATNRPVLPDDFSSDMAHAPLAGFGYGLPLSRLYARYFGGDLQLISMEGYGTDAYVYLKVAADSAPETLPSFRKQETRF